MQADVSIWSYIANAGLVVKSVIVLLVGASIFSWTFIFQRFQYLRQGWRSLKNFEQQFWSGIDLDELFDKISQDADRRNGLSNIFYAGMHEYKQSAAQNKGVLEGTERAMRAAMNYEQEQLEQHLSFLATVGSTSPYVGLFGTVWGIMTAFQGLSKVQQATIAMVAPGISEALIATAIGLFAAIPAVIAYNRLSAEIDRLLSRYEAFQEEFISLLSRYY